jgi:hypothetical protein
MRSKVLGKARTVRIVGLLLIIVMLGMGCADQRAAQYASATAKFDQALNAIDQAGQGYVPVSGGQSTHPTLEEFRRAKLNEAAALLEDVVKLGSPLQKQGARLLLADIHASAARAARRAGMDAWADIANRSAALINTIVAIQRSAVRGGSLRVDDSLLLRNLESDRDATSRLLAEHKHTLGDLDKRIKDLQGNIERLNQKRQEFVAQAQSLRDEAFAASGAKRYELYTQAAAVTRQAEQTGAEADKLKVNLDIYQSERVILQRQIQAADRFLESVTAQITDTRQRTGQMHAAADQSDQRRDELMDSLRENVNALAAEYDANVETKLDEATEAINHAVAVSQAAVDAGGEGVRDAKLELLGKINTRVHILTSHILAKGDLGQTLTVIADRAGGGDHPLMPEQAESFRNSVTRIAEEQRALIADAFDAISQGQEIATELIQGAAETDPSAAIARTQQSQLDSYRQRITRIRMTVAAAESDDGTANQ